MNYKSLHNDDVCLGEGENTVVVLGWTSKKHALKLLDKKLYAAIGNLFTPGVGIDLLIRNLLANPQITRVLALNSTVFDLNSGSIKALTDLFISGVENNKIKTSVSHAKLGTDLSSEYVDYLRKNVEYIEVDNIGTLVSKLPQGSAGEERTKAVILPFKVTQQQSYSTELTGARMEGNSVAEAWVKVLHTVMKGGKEYPTRYGHTMREVLNVVSVISSKDNFFPSWLPQTAEEISNYQRTFFEVSTEPGSYTYGERMRSYFGVDQIKQIATTLQTEHSRSAVISLWSVNDHDNSSPPCLTNCWFRLRDGELNLTAVFRSHDVCSAYVSNAYGLLALAEHIAAELRSRGIEAELGTLTILSESAHYYSTHENTVAEIVETHYSKIVQKATSRYYDPVGNFVVSVGEEINVDLLSPDGSKLLKQWSDKNPLRLSREICAEVPQIQPAHAAYLGVEIQRAAASIQHQSTFVQDKH